MKWRMFGMPGQATGDFPICVMNAYYHKKHEYYWVCFIIRNNIKYGLGVGSERFQRYKAYYKMKGWDIPQHATRNAVVSVTECFLS